MITYEQRLTSDFDWALREGSMHFEKESAVHKTLRKIAHRLKGLGIPYAVVGGMAMFFYGYRRFTEHVDLLVTQESLAEIHWRLDGLGYVAAFEGSKQLRDAEYGVKIEFLVTGGYPGDGQPKAIPFPNPAAVAMETEGLHILRLPSLIELKLASGMSNPRRAQDLMDVQQLIEVVNLTENLGDQLDPSVRSRFKELWAAVHNNPPKERLKKGTVRFEPVGWPLNADFRRAEMIHIFGEARAWLPVVELQAIVPQPRDRRAISVQRGFA